MSSSRSCLVGGILIGLIACGPKPESVSRAEKAAAAPPVKILNFYASRGVVKKGESTTICYGVEGASSVSISPKVESVWPSRTRCFSVSPERTTTYTLSASGEGGQASASLVVRVEAAPPAATPSKSGMIRLFLASSEEVTAGQPLTLCYGVRNAQSVRIEPKVRELKPVEKLCFAVALNHTTTFTLTAVSPQGREEHEKVTVQVK